MKKEIQKNQEDLNKEMKKEIQKNQEKLSRIEENQEDL
jgi:hypothetical protein